MEQRITRAKKPRSPGRRAVRDPGRARARRALGAVAAVLYLMFNEGYSATGGDAHIRAPLCEEAIRLGAAAPALFPDEPEIMGLLGADAAAARRAPARLDADGAIVLLEDQDRPLWNRSRIERGTRAARQGNSARRPGPFQVQAAIAALARARGEPEDTDWAQIDLLYATLERLQPSPVVTLNRAVAVSQGARARQPALALIEPLADELDELLLLFRREGRAAPQLGRATTRRASRSIAPSRSPTPPPRPRTFARRLNA